MQQSSNKDSVLVKSYINGDELALERLIKRHQQRIYSFIYSKTQNKEVTEDVFQDTFIKVIRTLKKGTYNEEGKFLPWVLRIAHNLVIDHFRKVSKSQIIQNNNDFDIFSVLSDKSLNIEGKIIKEQILQDVKSLLDELPEEQREVLEMRLFNDLSFNEIAENTGVSINTALGRMRYALINLRKIIEKYNIILVG